jgi:polyisoprenoid-binding protein YceI
MKNSTTTKWVLDPIHSELSFKVKHLMIANVKGVFSQFTAEIDGEDIANSAVKATIDASSISTNNTDRDTHLKSADFFDVENHKDILFTSTYFKKTDDENYKLIGQLTIKEVTKEIVLDVEFGGTNKDPWGNEKAGFTLTGKINRKDFGLTWNAALETGGVMVSEDVKINAEVQFVKQA